MYSPSDNSFKLTIDEATTTLEHPMTMGAKLEVSTNALAEQFFVSSTSLHSLLPPVVRYVSPDFRKFVVERPPTTVKIRYKDGPSESSGEIEEFKLNLPWCVYIICLVNHIDLVMLDELYIYARNTPLYSLDEPLYILPVPNIYENGRVCVGEGSEDLLTHCGRTDYQGIINTVISSFWDSVFNRDLLTFCTSELIPEAFKKIINLSNEGIYTAMDVLSTFASISEYDVLEIAWAQGQTAYPDEHGKIKYRTASTIGGFIEYWERISAPNISGSQPFLSFVRELALKTVNQKCDY